jgi:hypothetical protein
MANTGPKLLRRRGAVDRAARLARRRALKFSRHDLADIKLALTGTVRARSRKALPSDAWPLLQTSLPNLMADVEERAVRLRVSQQAKSARHRKAHKTALLNAAKRVAGVLRELEQISNIDRIAFDRIGVDAYVTAVSSLSAWQVYLQAMHRSEAAAVERGGKPPDCWRRALLEELAAFWSERGWKPTTTLDGPYGSVARKILQIRRHYLRRGDESVSDVALGYRELRASILMGAAATAELRRLRFAILMEQLGAPSPGPTFLEKLGESSLKNLPLMVHESTVVQ